MGASVDKLASVTASTKRSAYADGKYGTPAEHIASLACTPLDPVSSSLAASLQLETPHELLQTMVAGGLSTSLTSIPMVPAGRPRAETSPGESSVTSIPIHEPSMATSAGPIKGIRGAVLGDL